MQGMMRDMMSRMSDIASRSPNRAPFVSCVDSAELNMPPCAGVTNCIKTVTKRENAVANLARNIV